MRVKQVVLRRIQGTQRRPPEERGRQCEQHTTSIASLLLTASRLLTAAVWCCGVCGRCCVALQATAATAYLAYNR